jgi:hypothetical protein
VFFGPKNDFTFTILTFFMLQLKFHKYTVIQTHEIWAIQQYYRVAQKMIHENFAWSPKAKFEQQGDQEKFSCTIYFGHPVVKM